jgi:NAD(P)-dependent dehydrogenase (short-subunit alcohol dehydrogenase family)
MLSLQLAAELTGIKVNSVDPGFTATGRSFSASCEEPW